MEYFVKEEVGISTYTVDRLSLYWANVPKRIFSQVRKECVEADFSKHYHPESFVAHRFGNPVDVVQYCGVHYEFWTDSNNKHESYNRIRLDWNPNKVKDEPRLMRFLSLLGCFGWSVRRVDYAIDVPVCLSDVYILTRKAESFFRGTRYYGTRHNSGFLRVYDKGLEQGDKGMILTRLEWEQHGNIDLDFTFDRFMIGDFSCKSDTYLSRVVGFVSPEHFNAFLKTADYKTRQKFLDGVSTYYVSDYAFRILLQDVFARYGLDSRYRVENEKSVMDRHEAEMLEFKARFPFAYQWLYGENSREAVGDE